MKNVNILKMEVVRMKGHFKKFLALFFYEKDIDDEEIVLATTLNANPVELQVQRGFLF